MQVHETQSDIRSGDCGGGHGEREREKERRTLEGTSTIAKRGGTDERRWAIDRGYICGENEQLSCSFRTWVLEAVIDDA